MTAKRVGLTLSELATLSLQDFTDFLYMWAGSTENADAPRKATQEDIDRYL